MIYITFNLCLYILCFYNRWEMWVLCLLNQELAEAGLQKTYSKTKINSFLSKTRPAKLIWEVALCCTGPAYETPFQFPGTSWAKCFPPTSCTFEQFLLYLTFCLDDQIGTHLESALKLATELMETFCCLFCVWVIADQTH